MNLTKTTGQILALVFAGTLLAACNGNNPFKGDSNPVKEYPSANEGIPYDPNNKPVVEPAPDNTQNVCIAPMHVSINPDHGSLLMLFTEEERGVYRVTVVNRTGQDYEISHEGPDGSALNQVSKNAQQAVYDFVWTPAKSRSSRIQTKSLKVIFNYKSAQARNLCGEASVGVDLIVDKTSLDPIVSFLNLPDSIAFSTEPVGFQIQVDDPASNEDNAPDIKQIGYRNQGSTGRNTILDASSAVRCDEAGQFVEGTKWVFNCRLTPSEIKRINANSTTEVQASFFVVAESKRNVGKASIPTTANVKITFAPKSGA